MLIASVLYICYTVLVVCLLIIRTSKAGLACDGNSILQAATDHIRILLLLLLLSIEDLQLGPIYM